jgi:hypothetical protein
MDSRCVGDIARDAPGLGVDDDNVGGAREVQSLRRRIGAFT